MDIDGYSRLHSCSAWHARLGCRQVGPYRVSATANCLTYTYSPSAILLARFGRNLTGWVKVHQFLQSGLTGSLTIGSFILGLMVSSRYSSAHFATSHQTVGLVLLLLLVFQASLGFYIHHLYDVNRIKRPIRNFLHIGLGLTTTVLGFVQISLGFAAYAEKGRITPTAIKVIGELNNMQCYTIC